MKQARGGGWNSVAAAFALFGINAYITWRLFRIEYLDEMWSIEGVFIGLARYIHEHFFDLSWFPLWYGGVPYQYSYPPLLHFLVAGAAAIGRVSEAHAYHFVGATFYCLGPVALFWTTRRFGVTRCSAFIAGLLYSLLSPACFLIRNVRLDSGGWLGPRLLRDLVHYGEGPHVASLVLVTFAIGMLHLAMEKRRPAYYFGAALALSAVVLTNWIGGFALALAVVCYLISGFGGRSLRVVGVGCLAYAFAMPWTTPSTIRAIEINARMLVGFSIGPSQRFVLGASVVIIVGCAWAMMRLRVAPAIRFGVLFFLSTATIALNHFWANIDLVPQANRYDVEMNLAALLAAAFFLDRIKWTRPALAVSIAFVACLPLAYHLERYARGLERPLDIRTTAEYKVSRWLGANMPGARVFAPGSVAFWMNAFSDTPELYGGFANGIRNLALWGVMYQIQVGDRAAVTLDWLNAFGCDAIVGDDPVSREFFHDYRHPEKLHTLRELWRDGAEVIYDVPRASRSLAHALRARDLPRAIPPSYDTRPLAPFLAALADRALPPAKFTWRGMSAATIQANLQPEHVLLVQISFDEGWRARVDDRPRPIHAGPLGQIVVEPRCNGDCTVDLIYDGGVEMRLARIACLSALIGGLLWIFLSRRRET